MAGRRFTLRSTPNYSPTTQEETRIGKAEAARARMNVMSLLNEDSDGDTITPKAFSRKDLASGSAGMSSDSWSLSRRDAMEELSATPLQDLPPGAIFFIRPTRPWHEVRHLVSVRIRQDVPNVHTWFVKLVNSPDAPGCIAIPIVFDPSTTVAHMGIQTGVYLHQIDLRGAVPEDGGGGERTPEGSGVVGFRGRWPNALEFRPGARVDCGLKTHFEAGCQVVLAGTVTEDQFPELIRFYESCQGELHNRVSYLCEHKRVEAEGGSGGQWRNAMEFPNTVPHGGNMIMAERNLHGEDASDARRGGKKPALPAWPSEHHFQA